MVSIALIAASSKSGVLIAKEAKARGFKVTGFVRDASKVSKDNLDNVVVRDAFKITAEDLAGFDVVISAYAPPMDNLELLKDQVQVLVNALSGTQIRLYVVGGAGSLHLDDKGTIFKSVFPEAFHGIVDAHIHAFEVLKGSNVNYIYVSPAADFQPDAPKTGLYKSGTHFAIFDSEGKSRISYADYALALVDEVAANKASKTQITFVSQ